MPPLKIGFVGLGSMGGRLAYRLTAVGDLCVYDAAEPAMEPFKGRASLGSTITDVAVEADVVGVCVATDAQVEDCVDDLLPVMKSGSVLMIHSTVSPEIVKAAAKRGAPSGITVIDAPVTVTGYDAYRIPGSMDPFVLMMLGGDKGAAERAKPLLDAYATETLHCGALGAALALKIINNLVTLVETVVAEEAFRLAALNSVPAEALQKVMTQNGVLTPTMNTITQRIGEASPDETEQLMREAQARNGVKDLALAEELAKVANTACATATFAKNQYWFSMTARGLAGAQQ